MIDLRHGWKNVEYLSQCQYFVVKTGKNKKRVLILMSIFDNKPCEGDNIVFSKLVQVHLNIKVTFVLGGHMTHTNWYIHMSTHEYV